MPEPKGENYLGVWRLIPELCIYERGEPPSEGVYRIERDGDRLRLSVSWRMAGGDPLVVEFDGPPDGSRQAWTLPGATSWTLTRVSDSILDSEAFRDDFRTAYARRTVSTDGNLMSVLQVAYMEDGGSVRNFQVYAKRNV